VYASSRHSRTENISEKTGTNISTETSFYRQNSTRRCLLSRCVSVPTACTASYSAKHDILTDVSNLMHTHHNDRIVRRVVMGTLQATSTASTEEATSPSLTTDVQKIAINSTEIDRKKHSCNCEGGRSALLHKRQHSQTSGTPV
jgi:hypothetical protein